MEFLSTDILKLLLTTICILCFETYHNTLRETWTAASHSLTARKHSDMAVERNDGVYYWSVLGRHEALSLVGPTMIENIMHFEYEYPALVRGDERKCSCRLPRVGTHINSSLDCHGRRNRPDGHVSWCGP